jgi:ribonuclease P/MRP protein subunit RPP40
MLTGILKRTWVLTLVIEIDLLAKAMRPGKKGYERIRWCFSNTLPEKIPFLISCIDAGLYTLLNLGITNENHNNYLLGSLRPQEMQFPMEFNATKLFSRCNIHMAGDVIIPDVDVIKAVHDGSKQWQLDASEVYDWIGMASLNAQR